MRIWAPYTFVRYFVALTAGILAHVYVPVNWNTIYLVFGLTVLIYVICWAGYRIWKAEQPVLFGTLALLIIFLFGAALTHLRTPVTHADHLINLSQPVTHYRGIIDDYPALKPTHYKVELALTEAKSGGKWQKVSGTILISLPRTESTKPPQYGTELVIMGTPRLLKGPTNPGEFDYRRYLHFHGIYHDHFLRDGQFRQIGYNPPNLLISFAFKARAHFDRVLKLNISGKQEYALATALVLGIKDELDKHTKMAYSSAGAMHVLAVSGLHLVALYQVIEMVLRRMGEKRRAKYIRTALTLLFIWAYSLVTGFSASVLRAAVMFTGLAIGKLMKRQNAIYNTLALSASALLFYNPYLIMDVGFLLSYVAVIGIVYLQPRLKWWFKPRTKVVTWIWEITCVSIAAQLATAPLGLLFFHQFPVYFMVSNLFVIPVSTIVLYLGMLVIVVSPLPLLAGWLGFLLSWNIKFMNWGIFLTEKLPYALINGIDISILETWLIYGMIILVLAFLALKRLGYMVSATAMAVIIGLINVQEVLAVRRNARFTVYNIRKTAATELLGARQGVFAGDSSLVHDEYSMQFFIWRNWWELDAMHPEQVSLSELNSHERFTRKLPDGNNLIRYGGKTILLISNQPRIIGPVISVDFLVLQHNIKVNLEQLIQQWQPKQLILDSSNKPWYVEKMKQQAKLSGVAIHDVQTQNAFMANFPLPNNF